ncbi:MAG: hypothetical protein V1797_11080 [Pseudomonadota bacterium]
MKPMDTNPTPIISFDIRRTAKACALAVGIICRRRGIGGDLDYLDRLRLVHGGRATAGQVLARADQEAPHGLA